MRFQLALASVVLVALIGCTEYVSDPENRHTEDSLDTIRQNLGNGTAVILDVRSREEWDAGHVQGALFRPITTLSELDVETDEVAGVPKDKIVYTYCRGGRRALRIAPVLRQMGYDVRPIEPGYAELIDNGFEKSADPPDSPQ